MKAKACRRYKNFINGLEAAWRLIVGPGGLRSDHQLSTLSSVRWRVTGGMDEKEERGTAFYWQWAVLKLRVCIAPHRIISSSYFSHSGRAKPASTSGVPSLSRRMMEKDDQSRVVKKDALQKLAVAAAWKMEDAGDVDVGTVNDEVRAFLLSG
ncbi:hypothetical protein C8R44DRAFT_750840 [Mycena epipterygia]|nr:hypothetical protein C8R44DRAFT_750840 [Mycena epipterygia]